MTTCHAVQFSAVPGKVGPGGVGLEGVGIAELVGTDVPVGVTMLGTGSVGSPTILTQ